MVDPLHGQIKRGIAWVALASAAVGSLDAITNVICLWLWVSPAGLGTATMASALFPVFDRLAQLGLGAVCVVREPERRALYEDSFTRMVAQVVRRERNGSAPEVAAETIVRALTDRDPRSLYLTGKFARRMATISRLPTPALDAIRRRIFGLPAPGSLAH